MGRLWVLDSETKGTGAQMVPLEKTQKKDAPRAAVATVRIGDTVMPESDGEAPQRRARSRFKVVDVMTREVLAEGADARATVSLLESVRSLVDVSIYAWQEKAGKWRGLSRDERRMLWGFRGR